MSKASHISPDRANKDIIISRGSLRTKDNNKTRPTRHLQGKTSMPKVSPYSQDRANKDIAITRGSLRARDIKKTRSTRHLHDKTSMPKVSPYSQDRANRDFSRGALSSRGRKTNRPKRLQAKHDKASMPKASTLSQDRTKKDTTKTRSARRTRGGNTTRPKRSHARQDKISMSKTSALSSNMEITDIAKMHTSLCTRNHKTIWNKRNNAQQGKTSGLKTSSLCQDRVNKDIAISRRARLTKSVGPPPFPSSSNVTATKLADIEVASVADKKTCRITGSAIMTDNRLITVDDHNNKVNLFDINTNQLLATLDVSTTPFDAWDVAAVNQYQAAVTLQCSNKILVVKATDTLVTEREIIVQGECNGVACNRDRLFVTYKNNPRLEILDLRGTLITTIGHDTDGKKLFQFPLYVCVSKDGETVYVSDYKSHTVTSLTLEGVVKAVYKDEELGGPGKVCTDHHGNVYVCNIFSRNVHMLTADCRKVKVILTEGIGLDSNVWSVSHDQDTNRLFIGIDGIYSNALKCYQLA